MLYFRLTRLAALAVVIASAVRAAVSHDSTRWTFSIFLIYCGLLVATIAKYAQENLQGQERYRRFGALLLFTSLSLYLTYGFHSLLTFTCGWIASGWGAALLVDHFDDSRSRSARTMTFRYFTIGDLALLTVAIYVACNHVDLFHQRSTPLFLVGLLTLAGLVRSGIFPFHRWLALTNEAPSPLSALLHAGIVNGFGLALLSFPSLHELRIVITVFALLTICFSLIIMRHRHDEKGKLANGTSMQMAYMAIEGALGLHTALLLHIIGHGSYKSWSFLRVGGVPARWKRNQELYSPERKSSSGYKALTFFLSGILLLGLAAVAFISTESALTLALLGISLTSYLGYAKRLHTRAFLLAIAFAIVAVASFLAENYGLEQLVPSDRPSRFVIAVVAALIIGMTVVIKRLSYRRSLTISARLLGLGTAPKRKIAPADNPLVSETLERYSSYFEPGLGLSTMVAQDPVSGLHSRTYEQAASELLRFGISSYVGLPSGITSTSRHFDRALDQASWWTAEASHNSSRNHGGPYSLWRNSVAAHTQFPHDARAMLAAFIKKKSEPAYEVLASLIGSDLGWFQYFLARHSEWIAELLALRAALFLIHGVDLTVPAELDVSAAENLLKSQELDEVRELLTTLSSPEKRIATTESEIALVMCIDVRSEEMRRVLEDRHGVATLGFAGFFGADITVVTDDKAHLFSNQMCPVILLPGITIENRRTPSFRQLVPVLWSQANRGSGALAMAEGFGLVQLGLNLLNTFSSQLFRSQPRDHQNQVISEEAYAAIPLSTRVNLAKMLMQNLPLQKYKEVIFVGHESGVPNNPFTSLYECGACGGNSGLVNAYLAAKILNDADVKSAAGLDDCNTTFGYAMHNTTHQTLEILSSSDRTASLKHDASLIQRKAELGAWWQPFPEFGLAGNAGAIIGPRSLTCGLDLHGKYFLHEYDWTRDSDGAKLANIFSGPGRVMQMINAQYNFTVFDSHNFSAGDKTRLNVFTQAGALSGSGGSLKRGMPWQALGTRSDSPRHTPVRLQIFVSAPQELIDQALAKSSLAALVANGWIGIHALPSGDERI